MLTDDDLDHLRELIIEFKLRECHKWTVVEDALGVSQHKIKKFVKPEAEYVPPASDLRKIYDAFASFIQENPRSRLISICGDQIDALFTFREDTDKYRSFKELVRISDDEQSSFSAEISGCFFAIRKHKDGGFFVSHVRVIDSYKKRGLPICRVSRKLSEGGDLIIDGSVFKKNNRVYIIGYERGSGDIRSIQLLPFDERFGLFRGFVSGFETTGKHLFPVLSLGASHSQGTTIQSASTLGWFLL